MTFYKSPISQSVGPDYGQVTQGPKNPVLPVLKYSQYDKGKASPFNANKHKRLSQILDTSNLTVIREKQSLTSFTEEEGHEREGEFDDGETVWDECPYDALKGPEIERNSSKRELSGGKNGIKEETVQISPRRSTSNKNVTIRLSHETFGEERPSEEVLATPGNRMVSKSLLKHEFIESISQSVTPILERSHHVGSTETYVNRVGDPVERRSSHEKHRGLAVVADLEDDLRLHGLADMDDAETVVCKHAPSCEHLHSRHRQKRTQRVRSGTEADGKIERCVICDITEATVNADKLDVEKLITETEYPQEFYDKYSRPFMKTSHLQREKESREREVLTISRPLRVIKAPERRPLSFRAPASPPRAPATSARQVEPGSEPCTPGRKLKEPSEFHVQCRPKMTDLFLTGCEAGRDRRLLKGLKGWLLKKDEVYKNTLSVREPKHTMYQINSLGMAFSIPDYNSALQDRKLMAQPPPTPRSYISVHTPMMKFQHNDSGLLRNPMTAPGSSNLGTVQTPFPCVTPREKMASQPLPPRSLPPISSSLSPGVPLSRLRL